MKARISILDPKLLDTEYISSRNVLGTDIQNRQLQADIIPLFMVKLVNQKATLYMYVFCIFMHKTHIL